MDIISRDTWHICHVCGKKIKDLAKVYGGSGIYYTKVFEKHIKKDHGLTLEEYFDDRPMCSCGICKKMVDIGRVKKVDFYWRSYKCGRNKGVIKWSKDAKVSRVGQNNPMFGRSPWNAGLTKYDNTSLLSTSKKMTNRNVSSETKEKQSRSAQKRKIHGHSGHKHSEYSKEKMRVATLRRIKNGEFKHTRTRPHIEMASILENLCISFIEEEILNIWSFDFYIPDHGLYIEVDGDYFHSNPKIYPKGPRTNTQKINWYRDIKKNQFCEDNKIRLVRFWECDIMGDKEKVICKLKKLLR